MSVFTISAIIEFFNDNKKAISKGENAVKSGHLTKCHFDASTGFIDAQVRASMKNKEYKVIVSINN